MGLQLVDEVVQQQEDTVFMVKVTKTMNEVIQRKVGCALLV